MKSAASERESLASGFHRLGTTCLYMHTATLLQLPIVMTISRMLADKSLVA